MTKPKKYVCAADVRELAYVTLLDLIRQTDNDAVKFNAAKTLLDSTQDRHGETVVITLKEREDE